MLRTQVLSRETLAPPAFAAFADRVPEFLLARRIEDVAQRTDLRESEARIELASTLEARLAPLRPHVAVLDSVRHLRGAEACCVVTGQQPGLLGGPLYSLIKALHAIRLARSLAQAWERPVVPIFWNHADDHDVAEVHHAWMLNEHADLQRVALAGLSSGKLPVSRIVLDEDKHGLAALRESVRRTLGHQPHAEAMLELFLPREGESLAAAFTRAMTALLGPFGLVVVEPDSIRAAMSHALARIVTAPVASALARGEEQLRSLGAEPAIESASAALVYRLDERGRHALRLGGEGFRYDGEEGSRTPAELAAEIVQAPRSWSPGALLRPLVQDVVFPSVAYVGGWGELAYLAQLGPLRRSAGVPLTAAVARWSCTFVEPEVHESLVQLELSIESVLAERGRNLTREDDAPAPPVAIAMREIASRAADGLLAQRQALAELDRGLAANLPRTADQIRSLVEKLCEKAERVDANRRGRGKRLVRRARNSLVPREELQERVLLALPFAARWGTGWLEELLASLTPFESGHLLVHFDGPGAPEAEGPR
jgi:bacillithiol biosynthesis cysteine-adding enzyme BshC